jgi:hypothetical protein
MTSAATDEMNAAEEFECMASYLRLPRLSALMCQSEGAADGWAHRIRGWLLRWEAHAGTRLTRMANPEMTSLLVFIHTVH